MEIVLSEDSNIMVSRNHMTASETEDRKYLIVIFGMYDQNGRRIVGCIRIELYSSPRPKLTVSIRSSIPPVFP